MIHDPTHATHVHGQPRQPQDVPVTPETLVSWLSLLRTVRAPFGVLVIAGVALLVPNQTADMLTALSDGHVALIDFTVRFHVALALVSLGAWYWGRALLGARFDINDTRASRQLLLAQDDRVDAQALDTVPRVLFAMGVLLGALMIVRNAQWTNLVYLLLWSIPLGYLIVKRVDLVEVAKRRLMQAWVSIGQRFNFFPHALAVRIDLTSMVKREDLPGRGVPREPGLRNLLRYLWRRFLLLLRRTPGGKWAGGFFIAASLLAFFWGTFESFMPLDDGISSSSSFPALVAAWFPGPGAALFALALMIGPLSALTFLADGFRIEFTLNGRSFGLHRPPIVLPLAVWVSVAPWLFSLHTVRLISHPEKGIQVSERKELGEYFRAWAAVCATEPGAVRPIIVAVSGGASRAAIWGARVLYEVEQSYGPGRPAVFAVSSVSGGSLGVAAYMALLAGMDPKDRCDGGPTKARLERLKELGSAGLAQDAVGPLLAGALLVDIPRAIFSPFAKIARYLGGWQPRGGDRAEALERAFERLWRLPKPKRNAVEFNESFLSLFLVGQEIRPGMPLWVANGTHVASGNRLVTVPFKPSADWPLRATFDALAALKSDIKISTAINNTARFPYLEPSGELLAYRAPGTPAPTLLSEPPLADDSAVEIIDGGYFENEGLQTALELAEWLQAHGPAFVGGRKVEPIIIQATGDGSVGVDDDQIMRCKSKDDNPEKISATHRALQLLAPVIGLYNVRGGHSALLLREARLKYCKDSFFHFYLPAKGNREVPLNWVLSDEFAYFIWNAMDEPAASGNREERDRLKTMLSDPRAKTVRIGP